jgi:hypothetical protein
VYCLWLLPAAVSRGEVPHLRPHGLAAERMQPVATAHPVLPVPRRRLTTGLSPFVLSPAAPALGHSRSLATWQTDNRRGLGQQRAVCSRANVAVEALPLPSGPHIAT